MNIRVIRNKSKEFYRGNRLKEEKNAKISIIILFLCFTFLIGVIIGSLYFKFKIDNNFFEENINIFEKCNIENLNVNVKEVFRDSLLKNILILVFFWIVGLSIVGVPILVFFILYEGFSVAIATICVLSVLGFKEGYEFIYMTMFVTTSINLIAIILLCNSAIRVTINVLKQKRDIKEEFIRHSAVCLILLILFIISSSNEAFMSDFCAENMIHLLKNI